MHTRSYLNLRSHVDTQSFGMFDLETLFGIVSAESDPRVWHIRSERHWERSGYRTEIGSTHHSMVPSRSPKSSSLSSLVSEITISCNTSILSETANKGSSRGPSVDFAIASNTSISIFLERYFFAVPIRALVRLSASRG